MICEVMAAEVDELWGPGISLQAVSTSGLAAALAGLVSKANENRQLVLALASEVLTVALKKRFWRPTRQLEIRVSFRRICGLKDMPKLVAVLERPKG